VQLNESVDQHDSAAPPSSAQIGLLRILNASRPLVEKMARECEAKAEHADLPGTHRSRLPILFPQLEAARAQFYRVVLVLQRMADLLTEGQRVFSEDGCLKLPGFTLSEIDILQDLLLRASSSLIWASEFDSTLESLDAPRQDRVAVTAKSEKQFAICIAIGAEPRSELRTMEERIWQAFQELVSLFRADPPRLRKCRMPVGITHRWDYLLGEENEDAPVCGRFYISKTAGTCGRSVCEQNQSLLHHSEEVELWRRVQELAERDFKKAQVSGNFVARWERARERAVTPQEALQRFREDLCKTRI
jgi:hypothetical protein